MRQNFDRDFGRGQNFDNNDRYSQDFNRNWNGGQGENGDRNYGNQGYGRDSYRSDDANRYYTGQDFGGSNSWNSNPQDRNDNQGNPGGWQGGQENFGGGYSTQNRDGNRGYGNDSNRNYQQDFGQSRDYGGMRQGNWGKEAWNRSDDEIRDGIYDAIDDERGIPHDTDILVKVENKTVTITGKAPNRYIKELAGRVAWNEPGVRDVHNNLAIQPGRRERAMQTMGSDDSPASTSTKLDVDEGKFETSARDRADVR